MGEITVSSVLGGMRGMLGMVYETSKLHPINGINYRNHDLPSMIEKLPKTKGATQPTPEGALWLLMTGDFPTAKEHEDFRKDLFNRGKLSQETENLIKHFPKDMHPMTQLCMGVLACQPESNFARAYREGIHKSKYWEPTFEDALDVCAKVSRIAAIVFHNVYKDVN